MQPCSSPRIGARGSCVRNALHCLEEPIKTAGNKCNDHARGNAADIRPRVGHISGDRYRCTGGCFDDISIQAKADLAFQDLKYLVFVPM